MQPLFSSQLQRPKVVGVMKWVMQPHISLYFGDPNMAEVSVAIEVLLRYLGYTGRSSSHQWDELQHSPGPKSCLLPTQVNKMC